MRDDDPAVPAVGDDGYMAKLKDLEEFRQQLLEEAEQARLEENRLWEAEQERRRLAALEAEEKRLHAQRVLERRILRAERLAQDGAEQFEQEQAELDGEYRRQMFDNINKSLWNLSNQLLNQAGGGGSGTAGSDFIEDEEWCDDYSREPRCSGSD